MQLRGQLGVFTFLTMTLIGCGARTIDVQGHRGARAVLPENSIPGFLSANGIGVTTLELDVIVTAAGDVVVSHEPWLNPEICLGPGFEPLDGQPLRSLYPMALSEIQRCDCGSLGHPRFPNQDPQATVKPTLAQVVQAVARGSRPASLPPVRYNIEIKHDAAEVGVHFPTAETATRTVLGEIERLGIVERSTVQSFSASVLEAVHRANVGVTTAWLMEDEVTVAEALERLPFTPDIYSPHHVLLTPEEVALAHEAGVRVIPWTVNDAARMGELLGWGVDGLISDDPGLALQVVATAQIPA